MFLRKADGVAVRVVQDKVAYGAAVAAQMPLLCHPEEGGVVLSGVVGCGEYVEWLCGHCDEANTRICASYTPLVKVKDEDGVKVQLEVKQDKQLKLFEL